MSARLESPSKGRMMSLTSPSTLAASAALARPGPIAAATSAGVDPSGISFTEPSGRAILNILVMAEGHVALPHRRLNRPHGHSRFGFPGASRDAQDRSRGRNAQAM